MTYSFAKFHIGRRTIKTVAAVIIAMLIVDAFGTTASKLTFAMMGAMAAVQPTFKESLESTLTQILGVFLGALAGVWLSMIPIPDVLAAGLGILVVITFYNGCRIPFSPSLPCFIVVMVCTTPDVSPMGYAMGRIWDSTIGLGIGMLINTLVFPYDNRKKIRAAVHSLEHEVIVLLEDFFDGDDKFPNAHQMAEKLDDMAYQLEVFANQRLPFHQKEQKEQLEQFRLCEGKARQLVAHMEVLCSMEIPGQLKDDILELLRKEGAQIVEQPELAAWTENDAITNYHVEQIMKLRRELLEVLPGKDEKNRK